MKRPPATDRLLDKQGRLKAWPVRPAPRQVALDFLAEKFDEGRDYKEEEVNEILQAWHTFGDHSLLRRELCDRGYLARLDDGSRYWKP